MRLKHPELRTLPTWAGFCVVCERERIHVIRAPHSRLGVAVVYGGVRSIIVSPVLDETAALVVGLHELAHLLIGRNELEADLFADLLVGDSTRRCATIRAAGLTWVNCRVTAS